jgi:hypothetical protein
VRGHAENKKGCLIKHLMDALERKIAAIRDTGNIRLKQSSEHGSLQSIGVGGDDLDGDHPIKVESQMHFQSIADVLYEDDIDWRE